MLKDDLIVLQRVFEQVAAESLSHWTELDSGLSIVNVRQGDYLFRSDTAQPYVFCIVSGLVKMFYDTQDGDEWIKAFAHEYMFFASIQALQAGGCASFSVQALEPTRVIRIEYAALERLAAAHIAWQKLLTNGFKLYGARKEQRERELLMLTAEQRYKIFFQSNPQLGQRLLQKDIAAYIRITPVALSRIRKRNGEAR
jgi:CRP-like cAMP-binding protein